MWEESRDSFQGIIHTFLKQDQNPRKQNDNYVNNEKVFFVFQCSVFTQKYETDKLRLLFTYFWPR